MWGHFTSELQNGVETLKEDWKKIRANVKNADVSDFKEYEKKELKLSTKDYTASLQKIVELTALLCSDYGYSTKLVCCKLKLALCGLEDSIDYLHSRAVKGNMEIEEELFDTATRNISAAYEVVEEMSEFLNTSSRGIVHATAPHIVDHSLEETITSRQVMGAALYECAVFFDDGEWTW